MVATLAATPDARRRRALGRRGRRPAPGAAASAAHRAACARPGGAWCRCPGRRSTRARRRARAAAAAALVAPVEVARLAPEAFLLGLRLVSRPRERSALLGDARLLAVHRLLDPSLLLRLEERVVLERVVGLVAVDRELTLELRVLLLQLEMVLDDLCEQRRGLHRQNSSRGSLGERGIVTPNEDKGRF